MQRISACRLRYARYGFISGAAFTRAQLMLSAFVEKETSDIISPSEPFTKAPQTILPISPVRW